MIANTNFTPIALLLAQIGSNREFIRQQIDDTVICTQEIHEATIEQRREKLLGRLTPKMKRLLIKYEESLAIEGGDCEEAAFLKGVEYGLHLAGLTTSYRSRSHSA